MKSPDDIKKALELCGMLDGDCDNCPYDTAKIYCGDRLQKDALAYINQLEQRLAQAERERDAAVRELKLGEDCDNCKHRNECKHDGFGYKKCTECGECPCSKCEGGESQYEWRGICEENSKEEQQ